MTQYYDKDRDEKDQRDIDTIQHNQIDKATADLIEDVLSEKIGAL